MRPPTFDSSNDDPITVEDWLHEMEKKLDLTTCSNKECVGVIAHQLTSDSCAWWDSYCDTYADRSYISWKEFTEAFCEHHVPKDKVDAKVEEFRNISQWS